MRGSKTEEGRRRGSDEEMPPPQWDDCDDHANLSARSYISVDTGISEDGDGGDGKMPSGASGRRRIPSRSLSATARNPPSSSSVSDKEGGGGKGGKGREPTPKAKAKAMAGDEAAGPSRRLVEYFVVVSTVPIMVAAAEEGGGAGIGAGDNGNDAGSLNDDDGDGDSEDRASSRVPPTPPTPPRPNLLRTPRRKERRKKGRGEEDEKNNNGDSDDDDALLRSRMASRLVHVDTHAGTPLQGASGTFVAPSPGRTPLLRTVASEGVEVDPPDVARMRVPSLGERGDVDPGNGNGGNSGADGAGRYTPLSSSDRPRNDGNGDCPEGGGGPTTAFLSGGGGGGEGKGYSAEGNIRDPNLPHASSSARPKFHPVVTARYPPTDRPDNPLNATMIPQFCYPSGADGIEPVSVYRMPRIHHFVLTNARGNKLYGTCLTVYEEYLPSRHAARGRGVRRRRRGQRWDDGLTSEEERSSLLDVRGGGGAGDGKESIEVSFRQLVHPPTSANPPTSTLYLPRVLCLLSTWPYLTAFQEYLTQLYRLTTLTDQMAAPLERYVLNVCEEIPAPPPGAFEVQTDILDSAIRFWAPPANQPIPYVALPFCVLFECLDRSNVLFAWYALATERKVLLVSSQYSLLTLCGEILCSLLFPMRWSHLYIPVLPRFLTPILDAPVPYLCGIGRDVLTDCVGDVGDETIVVDLDRNVITMGPNTPQLPPIPLKRTAKLEAALEANTGDAFWNARGLTGDAVKKLMTSKTRTKLTDALGDAEEVWKEKLNAYGEAFNLAFTPDSPNILNDEGRAADPIGNGDEGGTEVVGQSRWDAVQEAFLCFYVSVLQDYRRFLSMPKPKEGGNGESAVSPYEDGADAGGPWLRFSAKDRPTFRADAFVSSQRSDFQPFLSELISTQMFDDFLARRMYDQGASDVTFFDQSISAKLNRSRLKLRKVDTPLFVSARAHKVLKTVHAVQPGVDGLPPDALLDSPSNDSNCDGLSWQSSAMDYVREVGMKKKRRKFVYEKWPETFDQTLFGVPRPIPNIIHAEFDRQSALAAKLRANYASEPVGDGGWEGEQQFWELHGEECSSSPEVATFTVFFLTYSAIVGREMRMLVKKEEGAGRPYCGTLRKGMYLERADDNQPRTDAGEESAEPEARSAAAGKSLASPPLDADVLRPLLTEDEARDGPQQLPLPTGEASASVDEGLFSFFPNCIEDICGFSCGGPGGLEFRDYQMNLSEVQAMLPTFQVNLDDLMGDLMKWGGVDGGIHDNPAADDDVDADSGIPPEVEAASEGSQESSTSGVEDRCRTLMSARVAPPKTMMDSAERYDRALVYTSEFQEARIKALAKVDLAFSVLRAMTDLRCLDPDPDSYKCLMEACGSCGDAERATLLMGMVRKHGLVADSEMYSCYIDAFSVQSSAITAGPGVLANVPSNVSDWMRGSHQPESLTPLSRSFSADNIKWSSSSATDLFKIQNNKSHLAITAFNDSDFTSDGDISVDDNTLLTSASSNFNANQVKPPKTKKKRKAPVGKNKGLLVTDMVKKQVMLGENLIDYIYPGISFDTSCDSCPKCSTVLSEDDIVSGWLPCAFRDYTTVCPQCRHRFVPHFSVSCSSDSFEGSQGKSTPLYCEFLSPWVLRKELQNVILSPEGADAMLNLEWRNGTDINATLWWNMIISFRRYQLPVTYLLQGSFKNQLIVPSPADPYRDR